MLGPETQNPNEKNEFEIDVFGHEGILQNPAAWKLQTSTRPMFLALRISLSCATRS